jgi:hypothetical protein
VALQTLLSAIAPIALAIPADPLAVLCTYNTDDSGAPARNDHPCAAICATMGHGLAAITPPGTIAVFDDRQAVTARAIAADWTAPCHALRGPQVPRAPPLA